MNIIKEEEQVKSNKKKAVALSNFCTLQPLLTLRYFSHPSHKDDLLIFALVLRSPLQMHSELARKMRGHLSQ